MLQVLNLISSKLVHRYIEISSQTPKTIAAFCLCYLLVMTSGRVSFLGHSMVRQGLALLPHRPLSLMLRHFEKQHISQQPHNLSPTCVWVGPNPVILRLLWDMIRQGPHIPLLLHIAGDNPGHKIHHCLFTGR